MERLFRKEREEEEHPLLCLEEPKREVETIREPDLLKKVLQVLELNAGKLARSVLRGESRGNATLLPDLLAAIRDCQLRQQLFSLNDPQYKHHGQAINAMVGEVSNAKVIAQRLGHLFRLVHMASDMFLNDFLPI